MLWPKYNLKSKDLTKYDSVSKNSKFLFDIETQTFELGNLIQDPLNIDVISFETKEFSDICIDKGN